MQLSGIGHADHTVGRGISNQFRVLTGLTILSASVLAFISLATWSVLDPSLSHANGGEAQNWLGYPGAVFADLAMQFFGLSAALALIPPTLWGWWKLLNQHTSGLKYRFIAWPLGLIATCVCFAALPVPVSWPLPVGLGGVTGDIVLALPQTILGLEVNTFARVLIGISMAVVSLYLMLFAAGLIALRAQTDDLDELDELDDFEDDDDFIDDEGYDIDDDEFDDEFDLYGDDD